MKASIPSLLMLPFCLVLIQSAMAQTSPTRSGRPVDPAAIENLNRINDDRVKRGQKPIEAPGYVYVPADKRVSAAVPDAPIAAATAPAGAPATDVVSAAPRELRWIELVNQPEFWPRQCTMKQTLEFQGGAAVKTGQTVKVDGITAREVELSTPDGKIQFAAAPEETDVLAAANADYAKLTPKQRALSYSSLARQRELWPYRVKITQTFDLGQGQRVNAGDEVVLLNIESGKLFVLAEKFRTTFNVAPPATDLLVQARRFVEDANGAPSRMVTELDGKLVGSVTGKPDPLPAEAQPRYIVFFRGSSTCSITRQFAPTLIKYDYEMKAKHPEYEIVYIMTETPENTGKFAKELGFSWRAVEYDTTAKMPVANASKPFSDLIPQLVVMDRTGKVLANGIQATAPAALQQFDALLKQIDPSTPAAARTVSTTPVAVASTAPATMTASAPVAAPVKPVAPALPLTWAELVNHPERWPDTTKVNVGLKFSSGALAAGSTVRIETVNATGAQLIAPQGFVFNLKPENCDLLAAANAQWTKFASEQRDVTPQTLATDPTLWPGKVKILEAGNFGGLKVPAGTEWPLTHVKPDELGITHPQSREMLMFAFNYTDIFARAREIALLPATQRPGRMAASLEGVTVDTSGKPAAVPAADYYVFYFAASTCPRCEVFTPKFIEHFNQNLAARKDVAFVSWPTDATTPPYLQYARQKAIPWPTLPVERKTLFANLGVFEIPGILVVDRFGNRVLASNQTPGAPLAAAETTLAKLDNALKPVR
jgi:hypothetical protein